MLVTKFKPTSLLFARTSLPAVTVDNVVEVARHG
jgi:hypothetical protein